MLKVFLKINRLLISILSGFSISNAVVPKFNVHQNQLEGLWNYILLSPTSLSTTRVFNSLGLVCSLRCCVSNRFPRDNDAADSGTTLRTFAQRILLFCSCQREKGKIHAHAFNKKPFFKEIICYPNLILTEEMTFLVLHQTESFEFSSLGFYDWMKEICTYRVKMTYQLQIIFPILFFFL